MNHRRRIVFALALFGAACDEPETPSGPRTRGDAEVGGAVVSTVDGHPITLDDVRRAAREAGVSPRLALRRLQEEEVLARAAERAGWEDHAVEREARRAVVQAFLAREVEDAVPPSSIPDAELREAFAASTDRFAQPERRRSVHLVALVPASAPADIAESAERFVREAHARLARSLDPAEVAQEFATVRAAFEIRVEDVPPLPRREGADPAYLEALYEMDEPGLVPHPVHTRFGWHAIVLTEIQPAWDPSDEEAMAVLRNERLAVRRAARLAVVVRDALQRSPVTLDPAVDARLRDLSIGTEDAP